MDAVIRILPLLILGGALVFIIYAWAKGWLKYAKRGSFTSQVVMHDWLNKDKREALEYVIDGEEEEDKKDAASGEGDDPGKQDGKVSPHRPRDKR